jgi:hypothetical protein
MDMLKRLVVMLVAAGLALSVGGTVRAQGEDRCFMKGGAWDANAGRCTLHAGVEVNINYPLDLADGGVMEQNIDAYLEILRFDFLRDFADFGLVDSAGNPWSLNVDYETFNHSPDVLSLKFTIAEYTGGAHGNLVFETFIFDLAENRVLELADLFQPGVDPLATIAPLVHDLALAEMTDMSDPDWIATGTAPLPENYQSFALTADALVFFFPPYQLAAYAAGPQTISLPLSDLADVLAPAFVPAG